MAGGPCAKIFMTVKCSLLSRQLMAPDDAPIFYFHLFIYSFIFSSSFVAPPREKRHCVPTHSKRNYPCESFFHSFQTIRGRNAFDLLEITRSSVAEQRS